MDCFSPCQSKGQKGTFDTQIYISGYLKELWRGTAIPQTVAGYYQRIPRIRSSYKYRQRMNPLTNVPDWLQYFLIHIVKRCFGIVIKEIEKMQAANKEPATYNKHNGLK